MADRLRYGSDNGCMGEGSFKMTDNGFESSYRLGKKEIFQISKDSQIKEDTQPEVLVITDMVKDAKSLKPYSKPERVRTGNVQLKFLGPKDEARARAKKMKLVLKTVMAERVSAARRLLNQDYLSIGNHAACVNSWMLLFISVMAIYMLL